MTQQSHYWAYTLSYMIYKIYLNHAEIGFICNIFSQCSNSIRK